MSIRPIDLQVIIPRVTEVSKTQQVTDHKTSIQQQLFAEEWRQVSSQRQTQVQHTNQAEDGKVDNSLNKDSRHGGQSRYAKRQARPGQDADTEAVPADPILGNMVDIKT